MPTIASPSRIRAAVMALPSPPPAPVMIATLSAMLYFPE
jgi:hypothetical protein